MSSLLLLGVAFATGAAVMVIELMGVRLMAPWFGQSQIVWTNVIGVVLVALAAGQWLGGRWAHGRGRPGPALLLVLGGGFGLVLPDVVRLVSGRVLPADLSLGEAYPFISWGSLFVSLVGLGIPMLALGAVAPWLVRLSREASEVPGRVAGRVLAAGTLGSLVGTFGSTHLLLGWMGSEGAVRLAGGVMVLLGLGLGRVRGGTPARSAGAVLLAGGLVWWATPGPDVPAGQRVAVETLYQWARIDEQPDGMRLLRLNEGLDSFHSVYRPDAVLTGFYYDAFLLPSLLAPAGPDGVRRVMVVGLGGGTMARQIRMTDAAIDVTGVEIDPMLVDLGREYLGFEDSMARVLTMDGRVALRASGQRYGAVLVDAYSAQIYIPHHMCTREFFEQVRERLLPGGVLALNLGGVTREEPVVVAVSRTLASVFDEVELARIPGTRNWIVLAWSATPPSLEERRRVLAGTPWLAPLAWMVDGTRFAPATRSEGPVLLDGRAPVEHLAHRGWR